MTGSRAVPTRSPLRIWLGRLSLFVLIFCIVLAAHLYSLAANLAELERQARDAQPDDPVYRDKEGNRISQADHDVQVGYERARELSISSHAGCRNAMPPGLHQLGCHRYVTEQKHIGPHIWQYHDGTKPLEQCLAEVDAHWVPWLQDMREQGEDQAVLFWSNRGWRPERQACLNEAAARAR